LEGSGGGGGGAFADDDLARFGGADEARSGCDRHSGHERAWAAQDHLAALDADAKGQRCVDDVREPAAQCERAADRTYRVVGLSCGRDTECGE
jgi:hypothetical protein